MAKNWKVGEAVEAVKAGDKEAIMDIGRRFPLFAVLAAQTNEAGVQLLNMVPDYVTARKIEMGLKEGVAETGDSDDAEDKEEAKDEKEDKKAADKKDDKKADKKADDKKADKKEDSKKAAVDPYEGKSAKDLFTICKERGIKVEPKQAADIYLKALKKDDAAKAKAAAAKKDEKKDDDWDEDDKKDDKKKDDDDWDI